MNIFVVDRDPIVAAQSLHDKHVVKMILETAQLLCGVFPPGAAPYKRTHYNHPCAIWTRASLANYKWLLMHGHELCAEFVYRFGHTHATQQVLDWCSLRLGGYDEPKLPNIGLTPFIAAVPDQYKVEDVVESCRAYYKAEKLGGKRGLHIWTRRTKPPWLQ